MTSLIKPEDLKIEFISNRPKGGQYVGTDRGKIMVTHLPSGTIAIVEEQRSMHFNRNAAIRMIEAYLTDPENRYGRR